ncbi:sodium:calcium antiporter [Candidatus Woesearchaeota archaeon]|nr:sodium:calcium antiporter [Candidatus Woesearchaeota archaeon]
MPDAIQVILPIMFFLLSCAVLILSGFALLKSITKISVFLRLSAFTTGFTVVALSTSLPELFVGIASALKGTPVLSLGNVIGSNIANLTLVLGIAILATGGIKIPRRHLKHDVLLMVLISVLPVVLSSIGGVLSELDGAFLLIIFVFYWYHLLHKTKNHALEDRIQRLSVVGYTLLFVAAIVGLYLAAEQTVHYGIQLAAVIGLPTLFVGLFFLAIGTSLPELIFQTTAMVKGLSEFALGDIIGSVITNSTLVIGITAMIAPIPMQRILFLTASGFMILAAILFATFIDATNKLTKAEGITLIFFYILFTITEFTIKGVI